MNKNGPYENPFIWAIRITAAYLEAGHEFNFHNLEVYNLGHNLFIVNDGETRLTFSDALSATKVFCLKAWEIMGIKL